MRKKPHVHLVDARTQSCVKCRMDMTAILESCGEWEYLNAMEVKSA